MKKNIRNRFDKVCNFVKSKTNKLYYAFLGTLMGIIYSNPVISADFAGTVTSKSNDWVSQIKTATNGVALFMIVAAAFMLIIGQKKWAQTTIVTVAIGYILIMSASEFLALLQ